MRGRLYGGVCEVHTSPASDAERGKESVIDFKASEGARYIWVSSAGPLSLEFNHFNVRRCPGTYRREPESKVGPTTEAFGSSGVYLCLYEVSSSQRERFCAP